MSGPQAFKRGMHGYATLVKSIIDKPATSEELAQRHGVKRASTNRLMLRLRAQGLVHVADWRTSQPRCYPSEVWAFGNGADMPVPPRYDNIMRQRAISRTQPPVRVEALTFGHILTALQDGHCVKSLCELLGLHRRVTDALITHMRALRLIHIAEWQWNGPAGSPAAVYRLGDKPDRPRPRRKSRAELNRGYRARCAERAQLAHIHRVITAPTWAQT